MKVTRHTIVIGGVERGQLVNAVPRSPPTHTSVHRRDRENFGMEHRTLGTRSFRTSRAVARALKSVLGQWRMEQRAFCARSRLILVVAASGRFPVIASERRDAATHCRSRGETMNASRSVSGW